MRALWKGALSFGLVNIPVKLYPATAAKSLKFNYLHKKCGAPLGYVKRCTECGEEVPWEEIGRGYQYEKGRYVIMEDKDFESLPKALTRTVRILDFVDISEIDPVYFQKSYYLIPDEIGVRPYILLREAMQEMGKAALGKVVIKEKEYLATVRVQDKSLVMETMFYADEIRNQNLFPELVTEVEPHPKELKMAKTLIDNLASHFDPKKYKDQYREALLEIVQHKVEGEEITAPKEEEQAKVIDLMEALKASVDQIKQRRKKSVGSKGA